MPFNVTDCALQSHPLISNGKQKFPEINKGQGLDGQGKLKLTQPKPTWSTNPEKERRFLKRCTRNTHKSNTVGAPLSTTERLGETGSLCKGEIVRVVLSAPSRPIEADAEVVWIDRYQPTEKYYPYNAIAVQFKRITDESRSFLALVVHNRLNDDKRS